MNKSLRQFLEAPTSLPRPAPTS